MAEPEWQLKFQTIANNQKPEDNWQLEFDDQIKPNSPNYGWEQYIRNTSARFKCSKCGRSWPSNKVMVVFHMRLMNGKGTVKARPLKQNCKKCTEAPDEMPTVESENLDILMEKLMEKIREKCYHEDLGRSNRPFRNFDVKSPHEPDHCEGCRLGVCTKTDSSSASYYEEFE